MICTTLPHSLRLSPNVEQRRGQRKPDIIILHYTGMETAGIACDWLCRPESRVSSHYLVADDGAITCMVDEEMRAWHAGESIWLGDTDINSASIGIEIHNPGHFLGYPEFPAVQMRAVRDLCRDIAQRWSIVPERVLAHSDVAPGRKIDPGERFDWAWLAAEGVGHWVAPALDEGAALAEGDQSAAVADVQRALAAYGYGVTVSGQFDARTRTVVEAFQRHFRPQRVDGRADAGTRDTLSRLSAALSPRSPGTV